LPENGANAWARPFASPQWAQRCDANTAFQN
jgi:hypothetical protein